MSETLRRPDELVPLLAQLIKHSSPNHGLSLPGTDHTGKTTGHEVFGNLVDPQDGASSYLHANLPASVTDGTFKEVLRRPDGSSKNVVRRPNGTFAKPASRFDGQNSCRLEVGIGRVWHLKHNSEAIVLSYLEDGKWCHLREDGSNSGWTGGRPALDAETFRSRYDALFHMLENVRGGFDGLTERVLGVHPRGLTAEKVREVHESIERLWAGVVDPVDLNQVPLLTRSAMTREKILRTAEEAFWANA
ncbi:MAG: hypothetical protein WC777_02085 [Candidatus Gracilibacteria bacterium]|jgi:hypothetical protein